MRFGRFEIKHPLCLAPMEDVSDRPFRLLCKAYGADVVYTEFTSSEALIRGVSSAHSKIEVTDEERPIGIQIYGSMENSMEEAARIVESFMPDFVDVNCGCWVSKIAQRGDGAGLLRDLKKFRAVIEAVQRGTQLPVTVKTRLGWDEKSIVVLEVVKMLEDMGIAAVTIHFRTRSQGMSGSADWTWIPRIKEQSCIPLIANGDIKTPQDVVRCFELGADGVMLGRAAIHSPWIFRDIKHFLNTGELREAPTIEERVAMLLRHLRAHVAYRGERYGVVSFRRYYSGYLNGIPHGAKLRKELMEYKETAAIEDRLLRFLEEGASPCEARLPLETTDEAILDTSHCY